MKKDKINRCSECIYNYITTIDGNTDYHRQNVSVCKKRGMETLLARDFDENCCFFLQKKSNKREKNFYWKAAEFMVDVLGSVFVCDGYPRCKFCPLGEVNKHGNWDCSLEEGEIMEIDCKSQIKENLRKNFTLETQEDFENFVGKISCEFWGLYEE